MSVPDEHMRRLQFIRRCRGLGFALNEIGELLDLVDDKAYTCADVKNRANGHLKDIKDEIRDLKKMERTLKKMISGCDGRLIAQCPIIDSLLV